MTGPLPDRVHELPRVRLIQGEVVVTREPAVLQTTLGSCVAVLMHDPITHLSAMSHAVMPETGTEAPSLRYVDHVVEYLVASLEKEGVPKRRVVIKLIGGASRQPQTPAYARVGQVGRLNVESAITHLGRHGLDVSSQDTGGSHGRRVLFDTTTGEVFVKKLPHWREGEE